MNSFVTQLFITVFGFLFLLSVHAVEPREELSEKVPCAVLEKFQGEIEILDSTRSEIVGNSLKASVPCGGWVSSKKGWAEFLHRQGYVIRIGSSTFVQVFDNEKDGQQTGEDHLVLYRGKVYLKVPQGIGEIRVSTANAKVRVEGGTNIITYSQIEENTQLVAIDHKATLENRFESSRKIRVSAGELTELNFKWLRVVPEMPKAVKISSLKNILADFNLPKTEFNRALSLGEKRKNRRLAASLKGASTLQKKYNKEGYSYERHPASKDDPNAEERWVGKLVGGQKIGEQILFPERYIAGTGEARKANIKIIDPATLKEIQKKKEEDQEKRRLIEQLKQIKPY